MQIGQIGHSVYVLYTYYVHNYINLRCTEVEIRQG